MINFKTILAIIILIIGGTLISFGVYIVMTEGKNTAIINEELYVIATETGYGVANSKGKKIIAPKYREIARVGESIYVKGANNKSYLYDIESKKYHELNGLETNIYQVEDSDGNILDQYILKYGIDPKNNIYRVIDSEGIKVSEKDYSNILEAYEEIGGIPPAYVMQHIKKETTTKPVIEGATIVTELLYRTDSGDKQYIVKLKKEGTLEEYCIMDSEGSELSDKYDKMTTIPNSSEGVLAQNTEGSFVILKDGKTIEIENGFEVEVGKNGYIIQKKGDIATKIYNRDGQVIIEQIMKYPLNIASFNNGENKYLAIQNDKTKLWSIYDIEACEKQEKEYANLQIAYLQSVGEKNPVDSRNIAQNTSFIYITNNKIKGVRLEDFKEFNIKIKAKVIAPLDKGFKIVASAAKQEK